MLSTIAKAKIMTLDAAATRLSDVSGAPLRAYSTRDFGRERNPEARSVVVPESRSREFLQRIRSEVGPNIVAFIGTTRWLGDESHPGGHEIVVANAPSQFDILRVAQWDAVNHNMDTEDLIEKLIQYNQVHGIEIFHAETDTIEFRLVTLPSDLSRFCGDLYEFCPDIVDQGVGTIEALESEIRRTQEVFLWWD